jgi:hypothetical protein
MHAAFSRRDRAGVRSSGRSLPTSYTNFAPWRGLTARLPGEQRTRAGSTTPAPPSARAGRAASALSRGRITKRAKAMDGMRSTNTCMA